MADYATMIARADEVALAASLEDDVRDMEQTIEGLGVQSRDLEQELDGLRVSVQDAIDNLSVLTEVPLSELEASVEDIIAGLRKAL